MPFMTYMPSRNRIWTEHKHFPRGVFREIERTRASIQSNHPNFFYDPKVDVYYMTPDRGSMRLIAPEDYSLFEGK